MANIGKMYIEYYEFRIKQVYEIANDFHSMGLKEEAKKLYDVAEMLEEDIDEIEASSQSQPLPFEEA